MKKSLIFLLMLLMLLMSCKDNNDEKNTTSDKENKEKTFAIFDSSAESYNAGNYDEAIQKLSKIIESSRDDAKAYMHRGEAYLAKSTTDAEILLSAKADFEQALVFDPTLSHAKECLAYIFYLQGDTVAARNLILEFFESSSESTYTFVLFVISDKYCPKCGRFEHTQHPEVWLSDMSDEELVEKVKPYVELYYDCTWSRPTGLFDIYGTKCEDPSYLLLICKESGDVQLAKGSVENVFGSWSAGYSFSNEYFEYNYFAGSMFKGKLYNIHGEDITNLCNDSAYIIKPASLIVNFESINEIKNNYRKYFSEYLSKTIDDKLSFDVDERFCFVEFNGTLFRTEDFGAGRGSTYPTIRYDTAKITFRNENSLVVKYEHEVLDMPMHYIKESTWTFGVENGKFVLINYEETHRD